MAPASSPAHRGPIKVGLVGLGKIARDQHLPALAADAGFDLVALASADFAAPSANRYLTLEAMLDHHPEIAAVVLCTPPAPRRALAQAALTRGRHVFLEKPPGATLGEVEILARQADAAGLTLFASWHSRFAPAVEPARLWLEGRRVRAARIDWREDVRRWHPGQAWIWEAGGLGVFDPGINALSIITALLTRPLLLAGATLRFPADRAAPIAADLSLEDDQGAVLTAAFDWRETGRQVWDIRVDTDDGTLRLTDGGARASVDGAPLPVGPDALGEYPALYRRFAQLIAEGRSEVDVSPLRLVADAFLRGGRETVEAFED